MPGFHFSSLQVTLVLLTILPKCIRYQTFLISIPNSVAGMIDDIQSMGQNFLKLTLSCISETVMGTIYQQKIDKIQ